MYARLSLSLLLIDSVDETETVKGRKVESVLPIKSWMDRVGFEP
jgi:hypothetical protein